MSAPQYAVFLCHNAEDKPAVRILAQHLEATGHTVFLDEWELRPGVPWQPPVESALGSSNAIAVLVGPNGLGPWQETEMRVALTQQKERGVGVVPVALPGVPLERVELPPFLRELTWIAFDSLDEKDASFAINFDRLVWAITGVKSERLQGLRLPRRSPMTAVQPVDRVGDMVRRIVRAIPTRNLICFIGRNWSLSAAAPAMNENAVLAESLFRELELVESDYGGFLPSLDDLTTCFTAGRGGESLHFAVEEILGNAARQELQPLSHIVRMLQAAITPRRRSSSPGLPDSPIVISTSLDVQVERALLRHGVPFVRLVQKLLLGRDEDRIAVHSSWFDVHPTGHDGMLEMSFPDRSVVFHPSDHAKLTELLRDAPEDVVVANPDTPLPLPRNRNDYVVLVKYLGSLDVPDSCVLTRDRALALAQLTARYNPLSRLIQSALSSRACLLVGFRPLDPDFILLYHTLLRQTLNIADSNPRCMPVAPQDPGSSCALNGRFMIEFFEHTNWDSVRDAIQGLGLQIINASPMEFLKRVSAELTASRVESR